MEVDRIALKVRELDKYYGNNCAVSKASFQVHTGDIHGFLGPNGAGKSTTLKIIAGVLQADAGGIEFSGVKNQLDIGFLPEQSPLYPNMSVAEYLSFVLSIRSLDGAKVQRARIEEVLTKLSLTAVSRRLIGHLSLGYRQRVAIAQAIIHNPKFVILDEPMRGLDPKSVIEMRELIIDLAREHTLLFSTHVLSEVSKICNRVTVISHGRIIASGAVDEVEKRVSTHKEYHIHLAEEIDLNWLTELFPAYTFSKQGEVLKISDFSSLENPLPMLIKTLAKRYAIYSAYPVKKELEDIFLDLTRQNETSVSEVQYVQ